MRRTSSTLITIGHIAPDPDWRMRAHHHPFHEMIAPVRGVLHVRANGQVRQAAPGRLMLYAAGLNHEEWSDRDAPLESYFVAFHASGLAARDLLTAEDPDGRIRQLLRWMHHDLHHAQSGAQAFQQHALRIILDWFRSGAPSPENEWVAALRDHIRRHLAEPLSLDDLARVAGCSRFHLVREYRRLTGRTPMADVRRQRADHAREKILSTNMPLKAIAPASGFANEYTLSRTFQQLYGHPPGQLRHHR